jgi:hypothetical protein
MYLGGWLPGHKGSQTEALTRLQQTARQSLCGRFDERIAISICERYHGLVSHCKRMSRTSAKSWRTAQ